MSANFFRLFRVSLADLVEAYPPQPLVRFLARLAFLLPALIFTARMRGFARHIRRFGLREAARRLLKHFYAGVRTSGSVAETQKGLLILSNHPGVGDSLALLSVLDRSDVLLVARDRDFFRALPELYEYLIPVPEEVQKRIGSLRAMEKALAKGKTVVLYPSGRIEPDPLLHPDEPPLKEWSSVVGVLVRLAAKSAYSFTLQTVLTGGVLPAKVVGTSIDGADREGREKRAVGKIVGLGAARKSFIHLAWGRALDSCDLAPYSAAEIDALIAAEASGLLLPKGTQLPVKKG